MHLIHFLGRVDTSNFPRIRLCSLSLPESTIPRIRRHTPIPPSKARGKVIHECLMMEIMMIRPSPKRYKLIQRPRKVVS